MKKNFLITADLIDAWEFDENNFLLGKWCDFDVSSKEKLKNKIPKKINIIRNSYHWENNEKKVRDYKYLENILEYLLELISEKLSIIHDVNENKEYWRIIVFSWLSEYTAIIFDRWESIRIFFKKTGTIDMIRMRMGVHYCFNWKICDFSKFIHYFFCRFI